VVIERAHPAAAEVSSMTLLYKIDQVGDELVVRLSGELDMSTADELNDLLLGVIGTHDATCVEADLDDVTFLDSSGIRTLVAGWKAARHAGCRFRVSHAHDAVRKVLHITGVLEPLTGRST
jgi:anti-sigma B factor antagonist